jgi:monovalent cation/hydrogen antiporter
VRVFALVVAVALVAAVVVGTILGKPCRGGSPVLLILFGGLLRLIPRFGDIRLDGDIVLREVQSSMDLEEARLLGPVDTG